MFVTVSNFSKSSDGITKSYRIHYGGIKERLMNLWKGKSTTTCVHGITLHRRTNPCESDSGLWMIRQGRTWGEEGTRPLGFSPPYSPWERKREGENIRAPSPESVPCMPWLVGNRVTCHRSHRINKLARSDEFGSIPRLVCCLSPKGSRGTIRSNNTHFLFLESRLKEARTVDNEFSIPANSNLNLKNI